MTKHRTTVFIESDMLNAIRKVSKDDERPMAYHYDKALRAYGPIKKLAAKQELAIVKPKGFIKPTVNELAIYFQSIGSGTCNDDANSFYDHFESNGWKVGGKSAMKCWKAAVRKWNKNKSNFKPKEKEDEGSFTEKHTGDKWREGL